MSKAKTRASVSDEVGPLNGARNLGKQLPPELGFTVNEYAERYGIHRRTAADQISKLARKGSVKMIGKRGRHFVYELV